MDFEMPALYDKYIQRIKEFLTEKGWTEKEILDFIDYLTK